jgi:hypothetical protein
MGELYMDDIDRALARQYKHFGDGCSLDEKRQQSSAQRTEDTDPWHVLEMSTDDAEDNHREADLTEIC